MQTTVIATRKMWSQRESLPENFGN